MSASISAIIITKNEERYIERCLSSLLWADEILVIDAESEDRTQELCLAKDRSWSSRLRLISRPWMGFRDQRTYGMSEAKNDWVFFLDADEKCTPELAKKIQELFKITGDPPCRAYKIRRIEYFLGKPISHGIWNPSYQDRFFHRVGVKYINDIHEYPIFSELPQEIHEPILHAPDFSPERFLEKMNKYTTIEAKNRVAQGYKTNLFRLLGAFPAMFLKNYFYYRAYKDGAHGFIISLLEAISRVVRHIKIWQYRKEFLK